MWKDPAHGRMLVLYGANGSGKTHVAKAVREWIRHCGHGAQFVREPNHIECLDCIYWHWPALLDVFKEGGWDAIDDMLTIPCLILDELGGGHDPSRVGVDKLCQVLSRREFMWTLITTNIVPEAWERAFDRRVASRLLRNAEHVDLTDVPDYSLVQ